LFIYVLYKVGRYAYSLIYYIYIIIGIIIEHRGLLNACETVETHNNIVYGIAIIVIIE